MHRIGGKAPLDKADDVGGKGRGVAVKQTEKGEGGKGEPDRTYCVLKVNIIYLFIRNTFGTGSLGVGKLNLMY